MVASVLKGVEINERLRSARSDSDLLNVLKGVSEAQSVEKRTMDALKEMLDTVTTSTPKQQTTHPGSSGNYVGEANDGTFMQDVGAKRTSKEIGNPGLIVDNNVLHQDMMSSLMISMKVENDRLKEANTALQKEKQQVMKLVDATIETSADMRKSYGELSKQYDSVSDQCLALAKECECLKQQVEHRQDQETVLTVSAMTYKDGHDISGDDLDSDVSTAATSPVSRAKCNRDSDASSTLTNGTGTGTPGSHINPAFAKQIPAVPLERLYSDIVLCKRFASGPGVGEKVIPGSVVRQVSARQIRGTSPPTSSRCYWDVSGYPNILEKVAPGSLGRQIVTTRIRSASPLIRASSKQVSSPCTSRTPSLQRAPVNVPGFLTVPSAPSRPLCVLPSVIVPRLPWTIVSQKTRSP